MFVFIVSEAVRRNKLLRKPTTAEVELTVKLWLRYAADRSGGRSKRRKEKSVASGTIADSPSESE